MCFDTEPHDPMHGGSRRTGDGLDRASYSKIDGMEAFREDPDDVPSSVTLACPWSLI
jgi:hypothetical protein